MAIKLEKVFGVSRHQILSYLERPGVDGLFREALKSDKQIIVYGSSKQGKTALVDKYVPYKDNINISCSPTASTIDIYKAILRKLNVEIISRVREENSQSLESGVGAKFIAKIPLFGSGEIGGTAKAENSQAKTVEKESIEINLGLANDVAELIKKTRSRQVIILENFHYLDEEVQKKLAFDLRTFQELGVRFIILGVWREKNRLTQFNGDLLDRIIEIPVEPWREEEFNEVVKIGEGILNIKFSNEIIKDIIESAFDSIGVVQELLKSVCQLADVVERRTSLVNISNKSIVDESKKIKAHDYSARHLRALESIAGGRKASRAKNGVIPLFLPYYTVRAFLEIDFETVLLGIRRDKLEKEIKKNHHRKDDVRPSDMSNLLHNFAKLQSEKGIIPPIFDYDQSARTLRVVDSTFYFFLRNVNRQEVLKNIVNPVDE